jgi:RNA polymerase sigma-70 factor (ECF subfamily)
MSAAMDLLVGRDAVRAHDLDCADATPVMTEAEFEVFHRATAKGLRAYAARVLGSATQADDIVQDAYLRLLRSRKPVDSSVQLRAYLFRIASNLIVDHWRSRRFEHGTPDAREPRATGEPDVPLRIDLERAFARLRPEERAMMWLAYVEGADHREIASALGFRRGSVRVVLHRTRRKLAALLRQFRSVGEAP